MDLKFRSCASDLFEILWIIYHLQDLMNGLNKIAEQIYNTFQLSAFT